ncbi:MAG: hypothetical protein U1E76_07175 [Planctomycetota bacterium]
MVVRFLGLASLLLCCSAPAIGGGKSFMGQEPPKIGAQDFLNRPERVEVGDYRGELLLVEFFATW